MFETEDLRIASIDAVAAPEQVRGEFSITERAAETVHETRQAVHRILHGQDERLVCIVGPCSIHDPKAAREYGERLLKLRHALIDRLEIVMRVYFEKPRTTVGWKGLINDPDLDDSFNINKGLRLGRGLLLDLNDSGLPAGVEFLDIITPQYLSDLVSWGAIGARTTESQVHRELASGLSCPVGFKNGTDGNTRIAVDAVRAARHSHCFLSYTKQAHSAIFTTTGNDDTHLILRGGKQPNYDAESVAAATAELAAAGVPPKLMVDFSHANSLKQHDRQRDVCRDVSGQVAAGNESILGVMIESHLVAGRQDAKPGVDLTYGKSITDACIGWDDTEEMLRELAAAVGMRRSATATSTMDV